MKQESCLFGLRVFFVLFFLGCFIIQVFDSIEKYLEGFITQTTYPREDTSAKLPSLSICPGFKGWKLPPNKTVGINTMFFDIYPWPIEETSEEKIRDWWRETTYNFEDFVIEAALGNQSGSIIYFTPSKPNEYGMVIERNYLSGRCYTIRFKRKVQTMWFFMKVNLGDKTKMPLHIHPDFAEVGLNFGYWVQPVNTIFIERGLFFYDIRLKRVAVNRKSTEGKPCSKDDNHNQYKCVTRLDGQIYTDQKVIDATSGCEGVKACWIPQAEVFIDEMGLPPCLTRKEEECMLGPYWQAVPDHHYAWKKGCISKCFEESWTLRTLGDTPYTVQKGPDDDVVDIYIDFAGFPLNIQEEVLLLDFNAIVSAVGGSLGLFLGFSCLDFSSFLVTRSFAAYNKLKDLSWTPGKAGKKKTKKITPSVSTRSFGAQSQSFPAAEYYLKDMVNSSLITGNHEKRLKKRPSTLTFTHATGYTKYGDSSASTTFSRSGDNFSNNRFQNYI